MGRRAVKLLSSGYDMAAELMNSQQWWLQVLHQVGPISVSSSEAKASECSVHSGEITGS